MTELLRYPELGQFQGLRLGEWLDAIALAIDYPWLGQTHSPNGTQVNLTRAATEVLDSR